MSKKLLKRNLIPMFALVLFSLIIYFFTISNILYQQNISLAEDVSRIFDGTSPERIDRLIEVTDYDDNIRLTISRENQEEKGREDFYHFYDEEGQEYFIQAKKPTWEYILPKIWLPSLFLILIAFGFAFIITIYISKNERSPVQAMVNYLNSLLSGSFDQETESPEIEEELINLLGSEKQKEEFKEALGQVRENETLRRQFSANVSHELKSPLTSINGYAEMIESGMVDSEDIQKFASIIHREGTRLLNMINEIIQLSKFDTGYSDYDSRKEFSLTKVIKEEVESISITAQDKNLDFILDLDDVTMYGNARLIVDVVRNLISNAMKYSKVGGGKVHVKLIDKGDWLEFSVKDNGIGISEQDQDRVFERFYVADKGRTRQQGSGTGLGLSLVKHTVRSHGGVVRVDSELGKGSTFTVLLPKEYDPEEDEDLKGVE